MLDEYVSEKKRMTADGPNIAWGDGGGVGVILLSPFVQSIFQLNARISIIFLNLMCGFLTAQGESGRPKTENNNEEGLAKVLHLFSVFRGQVSYFSIPQFSFSTPTHDGRERRGRSHVIMSHSTAEI